MKHCQKYILSQPYPTLGKVKPNPAVVSMLQNAYAGAEGELTAVMQYSYNHLLTQYMPALSELFACTAQVEMRHMELLGQMILAYGGDPRYFYFPDVRRAQWWMGGLVNYEKQPQHMLRRAIASEQNAVRDYQKLARQLKEPAACALINRILADEQHHIVLFKQALAVPNT